jgi:hypothetical protein
METTPQTPQQQDTFKTIVDKGAISDLLSFLGQVFGNSELIAAAKIELSLMQDAYIKATEQKAEAKAGLSLSSPEAFKAVRYAIELSSFYVEDITLKQPGVDMILHDNNVIEVKSAYGDAEVDLYGENAVSLTENVLEALQKLEKSNEQTPES